MSLLIKGEKMPTECLGCLLICQRWTGDKWEYKCKVSGESVNVNNNVRPSDCPLIDIPPHGRLIDANKLKEHKYHDSDRYENAVSVAQIDWAPTIIEPEE